MLIPARTGEPIMTYPRGDDRRLDESWGWDVAVLLLFIAMLAVAMWVYRDDDNRPEVAVSAPNVTVGQRTPSPPRTSAPPPGTEVPLR
jgi:hypothetical protein